MISGAVHILGGMVGIMEVTGAMVLTMEEIGAMEIILTSQDNVQVTMEGRGEALNNHQEGVVVVEELLAIMEDGIMAGTMEGRDSTRDITMDAASGIVSVPVLLNAATCTMATNVPSHSTMGEELQSIGRSLF